MTRTFSWFGVATVLCASASPAAAETDCVFVTQGTTLLLSGDCTTDASLSIPEGFTLDGRGFRITAVDPPGGHFLGAVVRNAGTQASVRDLTIDTNALASVCDAASSPDQRLRGILFDGASGTIQSNRVLNVNQGESGCQEGNAIEVRNLDGEASDTLQVEITENEVSAYQKTGILVNGNVDAEVTRNLIVGFGPVDFIAQNGIQLGFGAYGRVSDNQVEQNVYTQSGVSASGILLLEAGDGVEITGNELSDNDVGIWLIATSAAVLTDNAAANSTFDGITIDGREGAAAGNDLAENRLDGNAVGIDLIGAGAANNSVDRNALRDHAAAAIQVALGAEQNVLTRNRIQRSGAYGAWIGADDNRIERNHIQHTAGTGLFVAGAGNAVTANHVSHSGALDIENDGANSYQRNRCASSSGPPVDCP